MPPRTILSSAQHRAIFDPPTDRATVEQLYTLDPDDLGQVALRRRGANRLGYTVQLCYRRHLGRNLLPSEGGAAAVRALLTYQIGCMTDAFDWIDVQSVLALESEIATSTDRGDVILDGMVDRLRLDRIVLPAASTLERLALIVRAQARKSAHAVLTRDYLADNEIMIELSQRSRRAPAAQGG